MYHLNIVGSKYSGIKINSVIGLDQLFIRDAIPNPQTQSGPDFKSFQLDRTPAWSWAD